MMMRVSVCPIARRSSNPAQTENFDIHPLGEVHKR
jgi:hypothetical protein